MAKIGILTFHRSLNYGAFMQAYSLVTRLQKDFPNDSVEIIDYCTKRHQRKYSEHFLTWVLSSLPEWKQTGVVPAVKATVKNLLTTISNPKFLEKRHHLQQAFAVDMEKMPLSSVSFYSDRFSACADYISKTYDVVIVGSDCVWEINNYPFPNLYFLHDVKTKKLSYAACAQGMLYEKLSQSQKAYMADSWRDMDYLSVRDEATEELVKAVSPELKPHHDCDPSLFLDMQSFPFEEDRVMQILIESGVDFSRPVIGIMGNQRLGKLCRAVMGKDAQIVSVYEDNPYADIHLGNLTPFQWAGCFRFFDLVFTNKFHGTLLSLKNGTPTVSVDFCANMEGYSNAGRTKMYDVLQRLDLLEHYYAWKSEPTAEEITYLRHLSEKFLSMNKEFNVEEKIKTEADSMKEYSAMLATILEKIP